MEIFESVKINKNGKQHPANFSDQLVHEIDSASPAWGKYWNGQLRSFVAEFPDVDGFCESSGGHMSLLLHGAVLVSVSVAIA